MSTHPFLSVPVVYESRQYKWVVANLDWEPDTGASGGGAGDASAANQTTEIAALGATTDVEATGNGSIIAVLKRIRTLLGGSLSVTGTFWQATQPVSGTVTANAGTGTFAVSGTVTANLGTLNGAATETTVSTLNGKVTACNTGAVTVSAALPAGTNQIGAVTLGTATGKTNVLKTGTITTTAATADQVVLTYTVTAGKTFYLQYLVMYGRLTALSATATILGAISLETPSGTKTITLDDVNPTSSELEFNPIPFSEPIPIAAGVVVRVVVTPAAVTSMLWRANFGGYEK